MERNYITVTLCITSGQHRAEDLDTVSRPRPLTWNTSGKNNNTTNNNNMTKKLLNPLKLRTLTIFVHVMAVARSSSGSLVIRYVFPVLWMTSCLLISQSCSTSPPPEAQCTRSLGLGYKWYAVIAVAGQCTHGTTFWALKVTFHVATPGAESAVYDCTESTFIFIVLRGCYFVELFLSFAIGWTLRLFSLEPL